MQKNYFLLLTIIIPILILPVYAQESDYTIPSWIKSVALEWANDSITDSEYKEALKFLIEQNIIVVDSSNAVSSQEQSWEKKYNESESKLVKQTNDHKKSSEIMYADLANERAELDNIKDSFFEEHSKELDVRNEKIDNLLAENNKLKIENAELKSNK